MDKIKINILKLFRKIYRYFSLNNKLPACEHNPDIASQLIINKLTATEPCMIARFGSTEMACLMNYLGVKKHKNQYISYILGKTPQWWWQKSIVEQMQRWSGFFPPTIENVEKFCELMLQDITLVDILGSWLPDERYFDKELLDIEKVFLLLLEPFWSKEAWTKVLAGKKVLVIHPFAKTIELQFQKRKILHKKEILPEFDLKIIKAVQSIAGEPTPFNNWFEALDYMKNKINETDFDIALIGAGAYGFPLAAHVKRIGKKAVHMGGSLQLLFGIRGKRWEVPEYEKGFDYLGLITSAWVKPNENETPKNANNVENACYW